MVARDDAFDGIKRPNFHERQGKTGLQSLTNPSVRLRTRQTLDMILKAMLASTTLVKFLFGGKQAGNVD
jgi:hypothetical protein